MKAVPAVVVRIPIALRLVVGLAVMVAIGTGLLLLPGSATRPLRPIDAFFTAVSALSVTGLSTIVPVRDLTITGQILLLILIQVGGVGFMALAAVTLSLLGRRLSLTSRLTLSDSLGLPTPEMIVALTGRFFLAVMMIELVGAALLFLNWRESLGERALFYALFHAVSAFCNAGFDLFAGLPEYPTGIPTDAMTLLILGALIVLGGLGIPVLGDLARWRRGRGLQLHTRLTLGLVVGLLLCGWFGIWMAESRPGMALADEPIGRQLGLALFQSVSARTAGFGGIQPLENLSHASQLLMIGLMFIGCAPASMGGGITTGTFGVLVLALISYARQLPVVQFGGRSIPLTLVRKAAAILSISLAVTLLATWLLLLTHPITLSEALFEVVSAFATCGLTLAVTGTLNPFGLVLIALMMFWGRLGALTLVLALAQPQSASIGYPEEQVLIG